MFSGGENHIILPIERIVSLYIFTVKIRLSAMVNAAYAMLLANSAVYISQPMGNLLEKTPQHTWKCCPDAQEYNRNATTTFGTIVVI